MGTYQGQVCVTGTLLFSLHVAPRVYEQRNSVFVYVYKAFDTSVGANDRPLTWLQISHLLHIPSKLQHHHDR